MDDLISRKAAIDAALEDVSNKRTHEFNAGAIRAVNRIKSLPSAQPEQKTGHWINSYKRQTCSICKQRGYRSWNFCPNCGADMRGENEHND